MKLSFSGFGPGFCLFQVRDIWRGLKGFKVQFWWKNLPGGLSDFNFKAVHSSLNLGSIQHYFQHKSLFVLQFIADKASLNAFFTWNYI